MILPLGNATNKYNGHAFVLKKPRDMAFTFILSLFADSLFVFYSDCVGFIHYLKIVFLSCSTLYPISELKIPSGYCKMKGSINLKGCPCILFNRAWYMVLFVLKRKKRQLLDLQKNKIHISKQL